ncbi:MAG: glycoside hydrolase family 32 protein [Lachnospiraceae bacterium]|nr:glycoside hydrolase family 32 protein [Lachnospiraceae bacterium]
MTSQTLREARKYEETYEKRISREERPGFHYSPRVGWLNDPNGFSYYQGKYHLFHQYHPYDPYWGPMHWGHAVSEDLLHWEYLPAVLAPDQTYDRDGCFSGSAVMLPDGRQLLMYTGVQRVPQGDGEPVDKQTQCLAVGNGLDYEKYEHNPVLDKKDIPEDCSEADFRDPKMWRNEDGTYSCAIANRAADGSGQILLYTSPTGFDWKFKSVLKANHNRFGVMWECPDLFKLDGKDVILCSPMDMLPEGFEYDNGNGTLCLIGEFDEETGTFQDEANQAVDYGIDFYAPQTMKTPDGRTVMIAWMQNWDTSRLHPKETRWFGQMTLPRELSLKNGRLIQKPVRELEALRSNKAEYKDVVFEGTITLEGVAGRRIDMEIEITPGDEQDIYRKFAVYFAQDNGIYTSVSFRPHESVLKVDRKFSGSRRAALHNRRSQVRSENGELKLRLILDRFSAELFINDGEQTVTTTIYTDQAADGISFFADGSVKMNVVKYDLIG